MPIPLSLNAISDSIPQLLSVKDSATSPVGTNNSIVRSYNTKSYDFPFIYVMIFSDEIFLMISLISLFISIVLYHLSEITTFIF